jgi:hypothetical protein
MVEEDADDVAVVDGFAGPGRDRGVEGGVDPPGVGRWKMMVPSVVIVDEALMAAREPAALIRACRRGRWRRGWSGCAGWR